MAANLLQQATDDKSDLMSGALTCHTLSLTNDAMEEDAFFSPRGHDDGAAVCVCVCV